MEADFTERKDLSQPLSFYPYLICFSAALFFFYVMLQLTIFNTISIEITQSLGLSTLELGRLSSSYFYACALFLLPAGLLLDKFSTRYILFIVSAVSTLGAFLFSIAHFFEVSIIGRALTGIGNAFAFLGCMRLASRWFPPQKIALIMSISVTIGMLGGVVSQAPFSFLIETFGYKTTMLINTFLGIGITLLILFIVRDAQTINTQNSPYFINSFKMAIKNWQNWLCGFYTGFLNLPVMLLGALVGNMFLTQGLGYSITTAGNITSLIFLGLIIGCPLTGWIADKIGQKRLPMMIGALGSALIILSILFISLPKDILAILFFILGLLSSSQVLSYPLVSQNNPSHIESTSLGIVAVIVNLIGASSQIIFAWILQLVTQDKTVHIFKAFQTSLIILPLLFLAACFVAFSIKELRSI